MFQREAGHPLIAIPNGECALTSCIVELVSLVDIGIAAANSLIMPCQKDGRAADLGREPGQGLLATSRRR